MDLVNHRPEPRRCCPSGARGALWDGVCVGTAAEQSRGGGRVRPRIRLLFLARFPRKCRAGRLRGGANGAVGGGRAVLLSQPHREPSHRNAGQHSSAHRTNQAGEDF